MPLPQAPKLSPIDEDLNNFEKDIRLFKIGYEQYFGGGKSRPPADIEWRIDLMIKRYSERSAEVNFQQRFRFNNLAQTYAKFKEMFRKRLQQREEGTVQRHFGAAAREIEMERTRRYGGGRGVTKRSSEREAATTICFTDPDHQIHDVERLYAALEKAREKTGEEGKPLEREQFLSIVRRKTADLRKGKEHRQVEYSVLIEDGKARMKARLKK